MTVFAQGRVELGEVILGSVMDWLSREDKKREFKTGACPGLGQDFLDRAGERKVLFPQGLPECSLERVVGFFHPLLDKDWRAGVAGKRYSSSGVFEKILIQVFQ
ncbi:hypothetical protein [Pulveribacter sp.]|uniref:hypothetical protein n=1 Tax=Pulveribacter sp. TaxID=2678893 RepID=UPI00289D8965|nr:hypothetical protein [Pulveribacter sp.]